MLKRRLPLIMFLLLSFMDTNMFAQEEGFLFLYTPGARSSCILLSIRDSVLVIHGSPPKWDDDTLYTEYLTTVKIDNIDSVLIPGHSNVLRGAVVGFGGGLLLEAIIASQDEESADLFSARFGSGLIGGFVGAIVGFVTSQSDIYLNPRIKTDFVELREHAVFKDGEPDFLRKIE